MAARTTYFRIIDLYYVLTVKKSVIINVLLNFTTLTNSQIHGRAGSVPLWLR